MKKRRPTETAKARHQFSWSTLIIAITLLIVAVIFDVYGKDNFRLPKELAFRTSAIALLLVFAFWTTRRNVDFAATVRRQLRDPAVILIAAIVAWSVITTQTSTNRFLSQESLITVIASIVFFFGCRAALRHRPALLLGIVFFAAGTNALIAVLQRTNIWQPFLSATGGGDVGTIALLGNPNDVGTFLLIPAVAAFVAATGSSGTRRTVYLFVAGALLLGLIASGTRTAIGAYMLAVGTAAIDARGWVRRAAFVTAIAVLFVILWPGTELGRRYWGIVQAALEGRPSVAFSERVPAILAAIEMFRENPVFGTGPGTFKWLYMRVRLNLPDRYPTNWISGYPANFVEAHNDHLQVAAETGFPGYALFLAAALLAFRPPKRLTICAASEIGYRLRLPLLVGLLTVMIAQFPLQLAAPRTMILFFAAFCSSWPSEA